ncbi:MAG: hypothetical protein JWO44_2602 [Bacteroidetes bacterium]|nr:hypothetical protein [Bacteroidota bacterium]
MAIISHFILHNIHFFHWHELVFDDFKTLIIKKNKVMKKIVLISYAALFLVILMSSCSVNKRVYRNGYHIEWNHSGNEVKNNPAPAEPSEPVAVTSPEEITAPELPVESENAVVDAPAETATASAEATTPAVKKKEGILSRIIKEDTPEEEAKINSGSKAAAFKSGFKKGLKLMMPDQEAHTLHLAIASFVLGIISLFAYYGAFVLGLLAIIFGAVAIHKIRKGEGTYKGNTLAWVGLICGIIAIALTLIIIRIY